MTQGEILPAVEGMDIEEAIKRLEADGNIIQKTMDCYVGQPKQGGELFYFIDENGKLKPW